MGIAQPLSCFAAAAASPNDIIPISTLSDKLSPSTTPATVDLATFRNMLLHPIPSSSDSEPKPRSTRESLLTFVSLAVFLLCTLQLVLRVPALRSSNWEAEMMDYCYLVGAACAYLQLRTMQRRGESGLVERRNSEQLLKSSSAPAMWKEPASRNGLVFI